MTIQSVKKSVGNRELIIETGRMAKQAHGAVTVQYGDTVVLATAVTAAPREGCDFFPLMVDYREKTYAAGRIPGGFFKREARPTERETLTSRLIDRPIRSLFHKDYFNDVNVSLMVLSTDKENPADIPAMIGASAALIVSKIPFDTAMSGVRVGLVDGNLVANPTFEQLAGSDLDLILAGTKDKIVMIEAGAKEVTEEKMTEAIQFGHKIIKEVVALQEELAKKVAPVKDKIEEIVVDEDILSKVTAAVKGEFEKVYVATLSKEQKEAALGKLFEEKVLAAFDQEAEGFDSKAVKSVFGKLEKSFVRELILSKGQRPDGRKERDIREITIETGVLPRTHGSSLYQRADAKLICNHLGYRR